MPIEGQTGDHGTQCHCQSQQTPEEYYASGGNELWEQGVLLAAPDNSSVRGGIRAPAAGRRPMPSQHQAWGARGIFCKVSLRPHLEVL